MNPAFLGISLLRILHGTGLRETAHTRLLAYFLNPIEIHGFERLLLRALISHITDEPWGKDCSLKLDSIQAERILSENGRRTDIWIEGTVQPSDFKTEQKWLVIVEAKTDSSESNEQLADYEIEADNWFKKDENRLEPLFVFLTIDGGEGQTSAKNDWLPLSFRDISELLWTAARNNEDAPGVHILRHYISGILSDMYGWHLPIQAKTDDTANIYSMLGFLRPHDKYLPIT